MIRNLVSVIVPVYNGEEYIEQCITKLEQQIHRPTEIIIVNDGSTDGSSLLCDALSERYKNIRMIHQTNQGVSSARNAALDIAEGEWIAFCDADDIMMPRMLDTLVSDLIHTDADLGSCGYFRFTDESKLDGISNEPAEVLEKGQMIQAVISRDECNGYLCNKLFRSEILNSKPVIRFDREVAIHEDELFILQYLERCTRMCFNPSKLYGYRENPASATKQRFTDRAFTAVVARERIYQLVSSLCDDEEVIRSAWHDMMLNYAVFNARLMHGNVKIDKWKKIIQSGFAAHRGKYKIDRKWSLKVKLYYLLLYI